MGTTQLAETAIARVDKQRLKRALGKRREARRPEGRVVVVHAAKGGAGTSTLAASLALALQAHGGPVALADLALWSADQDLLWNIAPRLRIPDVLGPEGHDLQDALWAHRSGVRILAGPAKPEEADAIVPFGVAAMLASLADRHPSVVVDTSPGFDEATQSALRAASTILVPVIPELTGLRATQRALAVWAELDVPLDRVRIVLWERRGSVDGQMAQRVLGRPVAFRLPWAAADAHEAINTGEPIALARPRSPFAKSVGAIAAALVPTGPLVVERPSLLSKLLALPAAMRA
jgi:pilus assembly protein CpaE